MTPQPMRQHSYDEARQAYREFIEMGFRPVAVIERALAGSEFDADELMARYEAVNIAAMQSGNQAWREKARLMEIILIAVL